jgi:hypothetical protein
MKRICNTVVVSGAIKQCYFSFDGSGFSSSFLTISDAMRF